MTTLRVAVVTGNPGGNAARICHHLVRSVDDITIAGGVVDASTAPDRARQVRRLRAWYRHGGIRYVSWRCWLELNGRIDPPPRATYAFTLGELGEMYGFPVVEVPNVNSAEARDALARLDADLGISVGNRVIRQDTFAIPRLGMINLHHGSIPAYRGGPPGFWELYAGERLMGVSVHRIDAQLDHGELLGAAEVPVLDGDDPRSLMERAYTVDHQLMGDVVGAIANGTARAIDVDFSQGATVRTLPSRAQLRTLQARLGRPIRHDDFRRARLPELRHDPQ
ncbi:MAG: methionyl-tRNA formyltransferase [Solirubrobacteraceae bacterium]|nr:methionyl-tRNA formyltransferase [Solirubrobacteraceae bacterium]